MSKHILSIIILFFIWSQAVSAEKIDLSNTTVKTINGKTINLGQIIGKKPVYLKFWATWCIPCREQMPHLEHSFKQYGDKVETIAINLGINDSLDTVKMTQQEFQLSVPIVFDKGQVLAKTFNLIATPYHVLINKNGKIIHTGHDASKELDKKIELLAVGLTDNIKEVSLNKSTPGQTKLNIPNNKPTLLFFTSAWCDWYLEKLRPNMSSQCINAQKQVNTLSAQYPALNWQGVLTRLWTGEKELNEYTKKFKVPFIMYVDATNQHFFDFKVNTFPTLIALKDGKEIFRTNTFHDTKQLQSQLDSLAAP